MRLRIDLKIFIFLIVFYFTKQITFYAFTMIFCILHELGHLVAGVILKFDINKIELMPWGVSIEFNPKMSDYNRKILKANILEIKKIIIALAGPFVNLILIIIFSNMEIVFKEIILYSNVAILLFNILPIYPLDGGRILKGVLKLLKGNIKATRYTNTISNIVIIAITLFCGFYIYTFKNIAIVIILTYLWFLTIIENKRYKMKNRLYVTMNNLFMENK